MRRPYLDDMRYLCYYLIYSPNGLGSAIDYHMLKQRYPVEYKVMSSELERYEVRVVGRVVGRLERISEECKAGIILGELYMRGDFRDAWVFDQ